MCLRAYIAARRRFDRCRGKGAVQRCFVLISCQLQVWRFGWFGERQRQMKAVPPARRSLLTCATLIILLEVAIGGWRMAAAGSCFVPSRSLLQPVKPNSKNRSRLI
jgi:hypothetical protein